MELLTVKTWKEYELLDCGDGYRLERFGSYTIARPDPQCIWQKSMSDEMWKKADAHYERIGIKDKGLWRMSTSLPSTWPVAYKNLVFSARLTPFKHTGIFPEQSVHWDFITQKITESKRSTTVLNLFAYTGGATLAASSAGAAVTHVDASRPAIAWARENQALSNLTDKPIRWILDDVVKFVEREVRRGKKYDGIVMDPPVYGHGPNGEVWDFMSNFPRLLGLCAKLLSDKPLFVIINAYAITASPIMLQNICQDTLPHTGNIQVGELALQQSSGKRLLSTGMYARWIANS
jgi:23S rRNA (cytosine1962-C5)-methyltransferase